jgi:hypothetical protein
MTGREQRARRVWRVWRGRRAAAIGAAVAAVAVAAVATVAAAMIGPVGSTLASPRAMPAASPAAAGVSRTAQAADAPTDGSSTTPAGWAPVPYESAQLSVPGSWLVESPQQLSCGFAPVDGMIFAGVKPGIPQDYGCGLTASLAWIVPAGTLPKGITHRKPTGVIHGIPVYRLPSGKGTVAYLVPELGVRIGARGSLATRVLATLTRSPLSVVLRRGRVAPVPASWTWRQFGGVWFATPPSWSLQRENQWETCGSGLEPGSLLLVDATKPPIYPPCPYQIPTATADQAQPGLVVLTGKYAAQSVGETYASCQSRHGVRICLSSVTGQGGLLGGVLIFSVSRPKHAATFFLLGLSGSGTSARAIFDSITTARH